MITPKILGLTLKAELFAFSILSAAFCIGSPSAMAQSGYATNFNDPTYAPANAVDTQDNWQSTDPYNAGTGVGDSNEIDYQSSYSTVSTDYLADFGGDEPGIYPGSTSPGLFHDANLGVGFLNANFATDFVVTQSQGAGTAANRDKFGFVFQNEAPVTSTLTNLFSVNFSPDTDTSDPTYLSKDEISVTSSSGNSGSLKTFTLGSRYSLTLTITAATFSVFIQSETPMGVKSGAVTTLVSGASYTGALTEVGAVWNLADTTDGNASSGFTGGGTNALLFDNFSIVPEPSEYAMLGLGLVVTALAMRRRSRVA